MNGEICEVAIENVFLLLRCVTLWERHCETSQWYWLVHCVGEWSSRPSLMKKSSDGCHFEIIWYTATACAVGHQYGGNCQVLYPAMGNNSYILLLSLATFGFYVLVLWVQWTVYRFCTVSNTLLVIIYWWLFLYT